MLGILHIIRVMLFLLFTWLFSTGLVLAEKRPVSVNMMGERAEATHLEGNVYHVIEDRHSDTSIRKGDFLEQGNRFYTDRNSRLELKLPDDSYIRFNEQTTFELTSLGHENQEKQTIRVNMILGKTWANVSKLFGKPRNFEITTKTAVMGVRGTVYRVNVLQDDTVIVKVYWGEILVNSKPASGIMPSDDKLTKPSKVLGPTPVAGPKPVSLEEWTYIVKSMQQMIVRPDGTTTKPFPFSPEEDTNDWVQWNQLRDSQLERDQQKQN